MRILWLLRECPLKGSQSVLAGEIFIVNFRVQTQADLMYSRVYLPVN